MNTRKVCLVGAGYISDVHALALRGVPNVTLHSVVDPNQLAAERLAASHGIGTAYRTVADAIAAGEIGCAHILTPPDKHAEAALPFLKAGIPAFIEKPLGVSSSECRTLIQAAEQSGTTLGVNQNFIYHPAFRRLQRLIHDGTLGRPRFANCIYHVPLRQIAARQFGHWMFTAPKNILLEQAVHPLSQLLVLGTQIDMLGAVAGPPTEISPGVPFYSSIDLLLGSATLRMSVRIAVGEAFPFWQVTVICDDGVAVADILNNRFFTYRRTRWLEPADQAWSGLATARAIAKASVANLGNYGFTTLKLRGRTDAFSHSMRSSIVAFHQALDQGSSPTADGAFGARLVELCEDVAARTFTARHSPGGRKQPGPYDIAVIGGTGFIGAHLVRHLTAEGWRVGVMARNVRNLGAVFMHENVVVRSGDIRVEEDVVEFVRNSSVVIALAHGGGGRTYEEVRAGMVGGAETIARACLKHDVKRLIHVGSIASLYLGPQSAPITGQTPPDSRPEARADYARAKAECDRMLMQMAKQAGLGVCILRPGLVVGEGGTAFHSGLGFFNTEQHCIGWNAGSNPLPFVLVEDVARAIALACVAPGLNGKTFNLVGDVRLTAQEYISELARALDRPIKYHPQATTRLWLTELCKWVVKRLSGRGSPPPSRRDLKSRGLTAVFDCADVKLALHWNSVSDRETFLDRAIRVHVRR